MSSAEHAYSYAIIRVVPRVERGEFINAGVILYCKTLRFLDCAVALDAARLTALSTQVEVPLVEGHLNAFARICRGQADAGPIAQLPPQERFYWLVAPRSTVVQTSPMHAGVTAQPAQALQRLMEQLVRT